MKMEKKKEIKIISYFRGEDNWKGLVMAFGVKYFQKGNKTFFLPSLTTLFKFLYIFLLFYL